MKWKKMPLEKGENNLKLVTTDYITGIEIRILLAASSFVFAVFTLPASHEENDNYA